MKKREDGVDEILKPLLDTINGSAELTSLLYDADMMPEQCRTRVGALHLVLVVGLWVRLQESRSRLVGANDPTAELKGDGT